MYAIGSSTTVSRASSSRRWRKPGWAITVQQESGVAALEMAFIAMFVFVLVAGIVDLGGAYQNYIIAINASREGARMYARLPCTGGTMSAVRTAVLAATKGEALNSNVTLSDANIVISPNPASTCPANNTTVSVTVQINYGTLMGPFWGATTFPIRARTSMLYF